MPEIIKLYNFLVCEIFRSKIFFVVKQNYRELLLLLLLIIKNTQSVYWNLAQERFLLATLKNL